jgi:hypothetical protein
MRWWESVELALQELGGVASLSSLYDQVRLVRVAHGASTPISIEEVIRKELEYNSSDSSNWRKTRDLFFSVHGIGKGVWGLRSMLQEAPIAPDTALSEEASSTPIVALTINRIIRDTVMTRKVKALHRFQCQICGCSIRLRDGRRYAEAHHIIPLGAPHNGPDVPSNIIVVCPNHHAMLDFGCVSIDVEQLRLAEGHALAKKSVDYHNGVIVGDEMKCG